jgi:signal transduction histidine kinase
LRSTTWGCPQLCAGFVAEHAARAGYVGRFYARPADMRLPAEIETACFRIVGEALANIARHAKAENVEVVLEVDEVLTVSVHDDGVGFDVEELRARSEPRADLGLVGMEERAALVGGTMKIRSAPGQGTTINLHVRLCRPTPAPEGGA